MISSLGENESRLFSFLKRKKKVTLDEIVEAFGGSRHALIVRIKYLSAKVAADGWIITRTSRLGRGAKATFTIEKKF